MPIGPAPPESSSDLAAAVLGRIVGLLGHGRAEWGRGMIGELDHLVSPLERRRFVAGCAWAVLTAPGAGVGTATVRWVSTGTAGCAALVVVALLRFPALIDGSKTWFALATFVALLATYVGAAALVGVRLGEPDAARGGLGVAGGLLLAGCYLMVGVSAGFGLPKGVAIGSMLVIPAATVLLGVFVGQGRGRRSGRTAVLLASLVSGLVLFLVWVGESLVSSGRPYDAGLVRDFRASGAPDLASYAMSDNLGSGMVLLVLVPLLTASLGYLGVTMARSVLPRR